MSSKSSKRSAQRLRAYCTAKPQRAFLVSRIPSSIFPDLHPQSVELDHPPRRVAVVLQ
jgi:hypothetical protein